MELYTHQVDTPFGPLGIVASDRGVVAVQWRPDRPDADAALMREFPGARFHPRPNAVVRQAAAELAEYFARRRRTFSVPLDLLGTPFQIRVWEATRAVPYGQVITYGQLAEQLGTGPRAVGGAMSRNRIGLFVPCHRVVAAGGMGGYGGDEALKRRLLRLEGVAM